MTINELLTAIDTWRAAYEAHDVAVKESPGVTTAKRRIALRDLDNTSANVTGDVHFLGCYRAITTLADEIRHLREQLAIETARAISFEKRITELETFGDAAMLVEYAQMKARIEAAAAIEANVPATGAIVDYAFSNGWNQCREQSRKALGLRGE